MNDRIFLFNIITILLGKCNRLDTHYEYTEINEYRNSCFFRSL